VGLVNGKQNNINHIAVVLDGSGSMKGAHANTLPKVIDALMEQLAVQSKQLEQETRITAYVFDTNVTCTVYDKDVLRMPKGSDLYFVSDGYTAMIDATMQAIEDLEKTAQLYGDHAFLIYVLTDGAENRSRKYNAVQLLNRIGNLPPNWTLGALVPGFQEVALVKRWGFPAGNVAVWSTTSATGVEEVGEVIKASASSYMTARSTGTRGTSKLFDTSHITAAAVSASGLKPLDPSQYVIVPVPQSALDDVNAMGHKVVEIANFVEKTGHKFVIGQAFYELKERSRIQGNKSLAVLEKKTSKVFTGAGVRQLIGLGDKDERIAPSFNKDYEIYVQSTSINRHLKNGQKVLLLK